MGVRRPAATGERGAMLVLFALVLPVILAFLSLVLAVGNWYVHDKHLQTMVDAAAFAGASQFGGCFDDSFAANAAIAATALEYAGDMNRDPATRNQQVQEPADVHAVFNSTQYWAEGSPIDGTGLDNTLGDPCSTLFLDVKATDASVPDLFSFFGPFMPDAKAHARVEIRKILSVEDVLPWAVPWLDPDVVGVVFVDENFSPPTVIDSQRLQKNLSPTTSYSEWITPILDPETLNVATSSENIGVVVVVANTEPDTGLSLNGTLAEICGQSPGEVVCYGQATGTALGFIHRYDDDTPGTATAPIIENVQLELAGAQNPQRQNCLSNPGAPYYFLDDGCRIIMRAVVDFGMTGDPRGPPNPPGVNARVEATGAGGPATLQWSAGGLGGALGTWTATINLPESVGRATLGLRVWSLGVERQGDNAVAGPYTYSLGAAGPVEYLKLVHADTGQPANSIPDEGGFEPTPIMVTVGLRPPLERNQKNILRVASGGGERTQAIDCDAWGDDPSDPPQLAEEIENGCETPLTLNYDEGTGSWRDYACWSYNPANNTPSFRYLLPFNLNNLPADPIPDCVRIETGARPDGQDGLRMGMHNRFEGPGDSLCTPNNWPDQPGEFEYPPNDDPRWVVLVIADWKKLFVGEGQSPEASVPIYKFGSFYVTGWTVWSETTGCPNLPVGKKNEPRPPGTRKNSGDVWGYFHEFLVPEGGPSEEQCAAGVEPCIAVLVE